MSNDLDMSEFQDIFFEECAEGLDVMEKGLMSLDNESDLELVNTIFRAAHSIKGGGGTFGFTRITEFTHEVETLLGELREGVRSVDKALVNLLLESVDVLRGMVDAMQRGNPVDDERIADVHGALAKALANDSGAAAADAEKTEHIEADESSPKGAIWHITWLNRNELVTTTEDEFFVHLSKLPSVVSVRPVRLSDEGVERTIAMQVEGEFSEQDLVAALSPFADEYTFQFKQDRADIDADTENNDAHDVSADSAAEPVVAPSQPADTSAAVVEDKKPVAAPANGSEDAKAKQANTIRVNIDKVDEIINLVGELVITQSILSQCCAKLNYMGEELRSGLDQLERHTRNLQDSVMQIRMLPISFVFNRFPRMVRDISGKLEKEIELEVVGEHTELDKTVLENISDPLVHLVRNSVDHGIESPEDRIKAGKNPVGKVTLEAFHEGGNVVIEISDDGAGLDCEKILKKARERNLIGADEGLSEEKIYDLIFQAGFSTADVVSDVSGRGVGMDVVKRNIRELSGTIEVSSQEGQGSTFTIRLPLTLAIIDGQLARVCDQTYVVPLLSVIESNQVKLDQVSSIANGSELYSFRDEYIPIIRISEIFGLLEQRQPLNDGLLIIVDAEGMKAGLHVDELLGQQQVVIKGLDTNYRSVEGVSGATILGDGRVALILDISGIVNSKNWLEQGVMHKALSEPSY